MMGSVDCATQRRARKKRGAQATKQKQEKLTRKYYVTRAVVLNTIGVAFTDIQRFVFVGTIKSPNYRTHYPLSTIHHERPSLAQLASDEVVVSPGVIYRKERL